MSGKPILASVDEDSAIQRILINSGAGYVVRPDSIESLKEGFEFYAKLPQYKIVEMGNYSLQYAKEYLTKETNLRNVVDRIKSIIQ